MVVLLYLRSHRSALYHSWCGSGCILLWSTGDRSNDDCSPLGSLRKSTPQVPTPCQNRSSSIMSNADQIQRTESQVLQIIPLIHRSRRQNPCLLKLSQQYTCWVWVEFIDRPLGRKDLPQDCPQGRWAKHQWPLKVPTAWVHRNPHPYLAGLISP